MRNIFSHRGRLRAKRVAILAADGFEYVELSIPKRALWFAGARTHVISIHSGRIRGMNLTEPTRTVKVHRTLEEVTVDDYDALLIPGGFIGPDFLRQSRAAREFVRAFDAAGKPIATLCHGPWLLASAELVQGRRLSSWPGIRDDLVHAGAIWRDEPVVRDRNWVSSRGPQDLPAFVAAMIELFSGTAHAELAPEDPLSSPQAESPLKLAVLATRLLPGPALRTFVGAAALSAVGAMAIRRAS